MTAISHPARGRAWHRSSNSISILMPALHWVSQFRAELRRRQTEKMLESLPADIRKDIGWPTTVPAVREPQ